MSVPVARKTHRIRTSPPSAYAPASIAVAAAAAGVAIAAAPASARTFVAVTVAVAWAWFTTAVVVGAVTARRLRGAEATARVDAASLRARAVRADADLAQLLDVTLPLVTRRLRDGERADAVLAGVPAPAHARLRTLLQTYAVEVDTGERVARSATADSVAAVRRLTRATDELDRLMTVTLPDAVARLRSGASADTALAALEPPDDDRLRVVLDSVVREFAVSERRAAAVMGAGTKTLSQVQAKAVSMLADLRELQDRHGGEIFGDLLRLDHNTSQLGLLADRLSLLMGGRTSRTWNRPIRTESILRGAVGRIAAYRRVRLHVSGNAKVVGYAAEAVMHLLAELMDNAANFSPPIDEVHVYVEERTAGLVVTIEDSGLKMSEAAMRRAEEAVSGRATDLAYLRSTRIGLVVVGLLAVKYHLTVTYRPSSRGGTGVVVLFPPQLLHQEQVGADPEDEFAQLTRDVPAPTQTTAEAYAHDVLAAPAPVGLDPVRPDVVAPFDVAPPPASPLLPLQGSPLATPNGLPVRPRGRTMAAADRRRPEYDAVPDAASGGVPSGSDGAGALRSRPARDVGARFSAFHQARRRPGPSPDAAGAP
ncbi:ATP-binding protein [Streptomyces sp. NPDC020412]|uniref:sensor histidine kinase n=1 Tax=Streptomyces sp. NPDC020412 TaxID=3365073 RepID=UPI0037B5891B